MTTSSRLDAPLIATRRQVPLIIFDCDGVLVETERVSSRVNQRILADLGWHLELDEFASRFVGCTAEHFRAEIERNLGRRLNFDWDERYGHLHQGAYKRELTLVPGVEEVLKGLDLPYCVASNAPHAHVEAVLEMTGLLPFVRGRIFSAQDVAVGKPAPDLFQHAARTMGLPASECVVVEDSVVGIRAALSAQMPVVGYTGGLIGPKLLAAHPTWAISSMHDLPALLHQHAATLIA